MRGLRRGSPPGSRRTHDPAAAVLEPARKLVAGSRSGGGGGAPAERAFAGLNSFFGCCWRRRCSPDPWSAPPGAGVELAFLSEPGASPGARPEAARAGAAGRRALGKVRARAPRSAGRSRREGVGGRGSELAAPPLALG